MIVRPGGPCVARFKRLADFDYEKAVELAGGLKRDAPRAAATLAIARTVLDTKEK